MIEFPNSTLVDKRIPKEAFYKHLPLSAALKNKFVSDVERIVVENSLTQRNLNLEKKGSIKEILLLSVTVKKQDFDGKILEAIARQNPHKLIFKLVDGELKNWQLAVYHSKLYRTNWMDPELCTLTLQGDTLNDIWDDLVRQIALHPEPEEHPAQPMDLDDELKRQEAMDRLKKQIQKVEKATWKEVQPKKKFELFTQLQALKDQLEELTHGKA